MSTRDPNHSDHFLRKGARPTSELGSRISASRPAPSSGPKSAATRTAACNSKVPRPAPLNRTDVTIGSIGMWIAAAKSCCWRRSSDALVRHQHRPCGHGSVDVLSNAVVRKSSRSWTGFAPSVRLPAGRGPSAAVVRRRHAMTVAAVSPRQTQRRDRETQHDDIAHRDTGQLRMRTHLL